MASKTIPRSTRKPYPTRHRATLRPVRAFVCAVLLYFFLSFRSLSQWTVPLWFVLAFVAIPIGMAFVLGRADTSLGARIRASLSSVGLAMGLYAGINLMRVHSPIASSGNGGAVFLVGLFVSVVYIVLASAVCVLASWLWARFTAAKEQ